MRYLFNNCVLVLAASVCLSSLVIAGQLEGSAWRLRNIASMDDTVYVPDDPAKYTLVFGAEGAASMLADCNRGSATWSSAAPGRLEFGPVASTRAMCPPASLSEKYLAQFQWVRSYILKDGRLFLATMADGSIIEFEPMPSADATIQDETIRTQEAAQNSVDKHLVAIGFFGG